MAHEKPHGKAHCPARHSICTRHNSPYGKAVNAVHALAALLCDINLYQGLILTRRQQDRAYDGAFKFTRGVLT